MTIRAARPADAPRLEAIARAAYATYVPRIGREPAPMSADYAAEIAAGHAIVISHGQDVAGYLIGCPHADGYFIENIAVDPASQGRGLGGAPRAARQSRRAFCVSSTPERSRPRT